MTQYRRREAFVDWLAANLPGVPYNAGDDRLTDPPANYPTDCSGSMWRGLHHGAGLWLPPVLSWTMARAWVDTHPLSIATALTRKGALLYMGANRGKDGFGAQGHVAAAVGDGVHVWETPSAGHRFGMSDARGRRWSGASGFDGDDDVIFDDQGGGSVQPPGGDGNSTIPNFVAIACYLRGVSQQRLGPLVARGEVLKRGSAGGDVALYQQALNLAIDGKLSLDGKFGSATEGATKWFQLVWFHAQPWEADGQAGPKTLAGVQFDLGLRNAQQCG
jgi:hypothetical protein